MEYILKTLVSFALILSVITKYSEGAKINTPRVLLPWFENNNVNFTFEIIEGGCYSWTLSRDDIIDLEPLYEDTWGHCSRAARVSVSKSCVPPGSVIILAEEVNTGEILRGDVNIDKISSLKVMSTTWKLYLEEAPEAFEVFAYDELGNKFSTLEGLSFKWSIENIGSTVGEDNLVTLVRWRDTDYEAPEGITEIEAQGLRSYSVLLYGQAMGECLVTVCLDRICTDFRLHVVASVVLTPATAIVTPGDTLRYKVVRARAGRLTIQDISETLYYLRVPETSIAKLEDSISLVRANELGMTTVYLLSGSTEVATASLTVAEAHSIKVTIRPTKMVISGEPFIIHCILLDENGHAIMAGQDVLIKLSVEGEANIDLLKSTQNGTITDAVAQNAGQFTVTAVLESVAGKMLVRKVEGKVSATAIDPLEMVPPEVFVAWTDTVQEVQLKYRGGGDEPVVWSEVETTSQGDLSLLEDGKVKVRGLGEMAVRVQLKNYPHVRAVGKVYSTVPELVQVSSTGHARVGRPHHLHVALTAIHPVTGNLHNYHVCNCASFAVSLLEGPEPHNVTAAPWIEPEEGACCVLECVWSSRGVCSLRVSRGRAGDTPRVSVRAAPSLLWPGDAALLLSATLPVIAEGESLSPYSAEPRISDLSVRRGAPPHNHPEAQLFTLSCIRKGEAHLSLTSNTEEESESVDFTAACAPHVARVRLEPADSHGNCSQGPRLWLTPGSDVALKVTLFDAVGRELLDEKGPRVSWETEPYHVGIQYKSNDRLFVETHPDFAPVPVPYKYYQVVTADEQAIGWSGSIRANIPETTATVQARVVAPLACDPVKVNMAWEGEAVGNIARISGGSGKYAVEAPKGVAGNVDGTRLTLSVPGPGVYDLQVTDLCVLGEKQIVEVVIEEVISVDITGPRAVGVGSCMDISAVARGPSNRALSTSRGPVWRQSGPVVVKDGKLCGLEEGLATVRAAIAGVWSEELEVVVFPPLEIVPRKSRLAVGGRLQLRHRGGPPPHLAKMNYRSTSQYVEVSPTGAAQGLAKGVAKIKLTAVDISNVEMASADAELEVVPISGVRVSAATQTLLVGSPGPVWVSASRDGLGPSALSALQPPPRVMWTLRDPSSARLYGTHVDDMLERQAAEGLSVRVVPLKPGVITVDVRVRNMAQLSDTLSWDSTIEILGISDIKTSVDGVGEISTGQRLAVAVGATIKLKSTPIATYKSVQDGAFEVTADGELRAIRPGYGVVVVSHKDERNNIYRESAIHVEVSTPQYCTAEPSENEAGVVVTLRSAVGRRLLGPQANVSLTELAHGGARSAYGNELSISGLDSAGAFMSFESSIGGVTVRDDVWVTGPDSRADRIFATGSWGVCLEGVGWRSDSAVSLHAGSGVTLAILSRAAAGRHALRLDRPPSTITVQQLPVHKFEFAQGEWPSAMVPLKIEALGLTSGPLLCSEDQKYALDGVQVDLPFICRTKTPHTANAVLDIIKGELGCSVVPAHTITTSSEVELCAEWEAARTCTRVLLLPPIQTSHRTVSLLQPPAAFTVTGHPHALKLVKITASPGIKIETRTKDGEIDVLVKNEASTCGLGYVSVRSRLTAQDIRVEVERECDVACGTLLGALFSIVRPYLTTLITVVAVAAAYMYIQSRIQQKGQIRLPVDPQQTSISSGASTPRTQRTRTWSRSPYAAPVYGDATVLPDQSFSPNSSRMHSTLLGL